MAEREKRRPRWVFWMTVCLVAPLVSYVASFGPACWICSRTEVGAPIVNALYQPIMQLEFAFDPTGLLLRYATLGAAPGWEFAGVVDEWGHGVGSLEWQKTDSIWMGRGMSDE